jgi:tetratricopeptide (TPR) repeat protein
MVKDNWRDILQELARKTDNKFILVNNRWEDMSEEKGVEKSYFIHQRSAIHSNNKNIYWKFPVHECLHNGDSSIKIIDRSDFITAHMRNQKKERVSYKDIIVNYLKTKPKLSDVDMMHLYYIEGNEFYAAGEHKKAIKAYNTYLKYVSEKFDKETMTTAYYNNTCAVYIKMSIMYRKIGELLKELKYKHLAFATKPCRETAIMLAMYYIDKKQFKLAQNFFNIGIEYTRDDSYNAIDWFWDNKNMLGLKKAIENGLNPPSQEQQTQVQEQETPSEVAETQQEKTE